MKLFELFMFIPIIAASTSCFGLQLLLGASYYCYYQHAEKINRINQELLNKADFQNIQNSNTENLKNLFNRCVYPSAISCLASVANFATTILNNDIPDYSGWIIFSANIGVFALCSILSYGQIRNSEAYFKRVCPDKDQAPPAKSFV